MIKITAPKVIQNNNITVEIWIFCLCEHSNWVLRRILTESFMLIFFFRFSHILATTDYYYWYMHIGIFRSAFSLLFIALYGYSLRFSLSFALLMSCILSLHHVYIFVCNIWAVFRVHSLAPRSYGVPVIRILFCFSFNCEFKHF